VINMVDNKYRGRSSSAAMRLSVASSLERKPATSALEREKKAISEADMVAETESSITMMQFAIRMALVGALK
jgi:hypothetical protein